MEKRICTFAEEAEIIRLNQQAGNDGIISCPNCGRPLTLGDRRCIHGNLIDGGRCFVCRSFGVDAKITPEERGLRNRRKREVEAVLAQQVREDALERQRAEKREREKAEAELEREDGGANVAEVGEETEGLPQEENLDSDEMYA